MRIVVFGKPLSGKGTLSRGLSDALSLPHVDAGQLLRDAAQGTSEKSQQIKALIEQGKLVSNSVIVDLLKERLAQKDCANGFILDGFPRTSVQLELLRKEIEPLFGAIESFCALDVPEDELFKRLEKRRANAKVPRKDDRPEVLTERLALYAKLTDPAINLARKRAAASGAAFVELDASQDAQDVLALALKELEKTHQPTPLPVKPVFKTLRPRLFRR